MVLNDFHDFPLSGPTWPHIPSRCPNGQNLEVHEMVKKRSPDFFDQGKMHRISRGTTLVFIKKVDVFLDFFSFLTNISKNDQNMSKISSQKCHGRWFGGSTWRSTGLNESVWSPGTPRGLPGAFWGPRGSKKGVFGFLGVGGRGGTPPIILA